MFKIGSHVSMGGKDMLVGSVKEALSYGSNTFMFYTGAPQNTRRKNIEDMKIEEARDLMIENNIDINDLVVHAPYIMNLANPSDSKFQFAVEFLTKEIERTGAIGATQIVLHPGAHVKTGFEAGTKRIIKGINEVFQQNDNNVRIALETMAGKGTEIGRSFEQIAEIIDGVEDNQRLSVCFDTCHTHDAGYNVKEDFDGVMNEFDKIVGVDRISVFHINDSKNPKGASKDRHENIGFGHIGFETLNYIVHHEDFKDIPKILETPYIQIGDDKKNKKAPYSDEINNFKAKSFNKHGVLAEKEDIIL
ncbi:deoxyribonuclease IV [Haloplasma contractile]|uniref:Probable endonuclease 4 n=1 Tax=Haloplasma contractile SSD-17B TaxID=1033810 RepID=U2E054_9MOLU|nr:deoxyribonuclease IV [Haloplasma contractile]ERJ13812.1 putative endonuclease 4 protein [Haloplasma contractile SSD-17B]